MKELNFDFCTKALKSSLMTGKSALQMELAVGLFVFHSCGSADIYSKKALRFVYAACGEDCLTQEGADYKTNSRRMERIGKLYYKLGARKIKKALTGLGEMTAVDALREYIEPLQLKTMEAVSEYCADPADAKIEPKIHSVKNLTRRATDAPGVVHFATENCRVDIPPEASQTEIVNLANKLLQLAATLKKAA